MTEQQSRFLAYAAEGRLLFHTGLWGGAAGYRWCGRDGDEAGQVTQWDTDLLDRLVLRGMLRIEPQAGPSYLKVRVTPAGQAALATLAHAA